MSYVLRVGQMCQMFSFSWGRILVVWVNVPNHGSTDLQVLRRRRHPFEFWFETGQQGWKKTTLEASVKTVKQGCFLGGPILGQVGENR